MLNLADIVSNLASNFFLIQQSLKFPFVCFLGGPARMKAGFNGLRGKEISLISIVLMSATIILWSWEKTPRLTTFSPPQEASMQLSSGPHVHVAEDGSSLSKKRTTDELEELHTNAASQAGSAQSFGNSMSESNARATSYTEHKTLLSLILYSLKGFTVPHVLVPFPVSNEHVWTSICGASFIYLLVQFFVNSGQKASPAILLSLVDGVQLNMLFDADNFFQNTNEILSSRSDEVAKYERISEAGKNDGIQTLSSSTISKAEKNETEGEKTSKQEEHRKDSVKESPQRSSSIEGKDKIWNNVTETKACNYAKGKWVQDNNRRPLYSGFHCKQWLSPMWACRLMQRTDFAYEKLRWQPKDCQMEEFEGSKFFRRMQNKTLAFVGDSLGRQQFQSLMCMITGGKEVPDVEDVGAEYGLAITEGSARPGGWAYRFPSTNTTILYYWSASLCDIEPIDVKNPNTDYAMHLDRPPAFLRQYLHKFDVLVLNTGHHWNRGKLKANRWVMYVGGMPTTNRKIQVIWAAKNLTIHSVVSWVNSQLPKYPGLKAFFRSISPRHFVGGEWNTGGSCDNTTPMSVGKEILDKESSDQGAASAVKGTRVKLLDITAISQLRDEGHISRFSITAKAGVQDCLHWCLPGVPDTWNEILFAQI